MDQYGVLLGVKMFGVPWVYIRTKNKEAVITLRWYFPIEDTSFSLLVLWHKQLKIPGTLEQM